MQPQRSISPGLCVGVPNISLERTSKVRSSGAGRGVVTILNVARNISYGRPLIANSEHRGEVTTVHTEVLDCAEKQLIARIIKLGPRPHKCQLLAAHEHTRYCYKSSTLIARAEIGSPSNSGPAPATPEFRTLRQFHAHTRKLEVLSRRCVPNDTRS